MWHKGCIRTTPTGTDCSRSRYDWRRLSSMVVSCRQGVRWIIRLDNVCHRARLDVTDFDKGRLKRKDIEVMQRWYGLSPGGRSITHQCGDARRTRWGNDPSQYKYHKVRDVPPSSELEAKSSLPQGPSTTATRSCRCRMQTPGLLSE